MNLAKTMRIADYATSRAKFDADEAAADFEDLKEAVAREVTFDDVLEELTDLPAAKKAYVMGAMGTDRRHFIYQLDSLFADAVEKIAKRRAWAAMTKGS